jgi:stearoyl-CoA desaturase (delta-9 desaturase)
MKLPPREVLRNEQRLGARVVNRAAAQLAANFNSDWIAGAVAAALERSQLTALQETLHAARERATEVLAGLHLPELPTREQIFARASATLAKTPSLDDIVDRAYRLVLDAVGARLCAVPVPVRRH